MGRGTVPPRHLRAFLSELEEKGARNVRRLPPRFDGSIDVTWDDPEAVVLKDKDFQTDLRAWVPVYILSGFFFVLVVVVFFFIQVFGGGLG
jgi:hypothetical protein